MQLVRGRDILPANVIKGQISHLPQSARGRGKGHLSPIRTAIWQMTGGALSPTLTLSGPVHLHPCLSTAVLSRQGALSTFLSAAAGKWATSLATVDVRDKGGKASFPCPYYRKADKRGVTS